MVDGLVERVIQPFPIVVQVRKPKPVVPKSFAPRPVSIPKGVSFIAGPAIGLKLDIVCVG
jgi:hypothetical protein